MSTFLTCRVLGRLLAGLFLLPMVAVHAGDAGANWYMRSWQSEDGLPDNSVSGVAQTSDGYLWVATAGGLMRFDGARFQEFPLANLEGVPNRVVRAMFLDRRGWLWLGMDRGPIVCITPAAIRVFTNVPDARATFIADDAQGAVWITYADGGLTRIQNASVKVFNSTDGWPAQGVSSLAGDVKGQLWFAKGNQVGVFRDGKFQTLLTLPETIWCIGKRREGGIWICAGRRLLQYDFGDQPKLFGQLPAKPNNIEASALLEDHAGALWIGTTANGLFCCTATNIVQAPASYFEIDCLAEDRERNIWVGTDGGGLDRVRPRVVELIGPESGLPYESVRSVCEDTSGAIWAATENGLLARHQNSVWKTMSIQTNMPLGNFSCVAADPRGGVWIGTHNDGFYHWQDGKCRNWRQADGLFSDNVRSILESSNGDVFVATDFHPSQMQRLRDGKLQQLEMPVQPRSLRAMAQDADGNIWVASADGELLRVDGNRLVNETPGITNRLLSIRCLYATPDGSLWIGYAGWGIGRLKEGKFVRITTEQGLYDDYVSQMVADDRGWLWCAGNRGIFQVQLRQLNDVAEGRSDFVRSIAYGQSEGFPNLQPNYENFPGAFRDTNDCLWFPMRTGLAVVHANHILNHAPPPVLLESVTVDGRTAALYNKYLPANSENSMALENPPASNIVLRLPPSHRKIDFAFTALSFTAPENIEFQYKLEGFDEDWVEAGMTRNATYSRLPPGKYRFQVRACNLAGEWSPDGPKLNLIVTPFYWQTSWFRALALAIFTLGIVGVVRYVSFRRLHRRLRLLEQQAALQKERARIAKDIHDDLGADLTQIAFLGELARQDQGEPEKSAERINTISTTARQAIKSLDEIVWAVNPRNDTLTHLIEYAGQFALDYLRLAGIRCRLDFPESRDAEPSRELSTDLRHNLFLVIKEALHNIVKHSQATEVWLRTTFSDQALNITIEDNGCGFEREPDDALADGLRNMRQRMNDIGGEFNFESHSGAGTKIILHLPWPR